MSYSIAYRVCEIRCHYNGWCINAFRKFVWRVLGKEVQFSSESGFLFPKITGKPISVDGLPANVCLTIPVGTTSVKGLFSHLKLFKSHMRK